MKMKEIVTKDNDQLKSMLVDFKKEAFNLRFQKTYGQIASVNRIKFVRKTIAKILTKLNENFKKSKG